MIAGGIVMAVGTVTLAIIFRRFGGTNAGGTSHRKLIAALLVFIFLCCLGLFALSYLEL